jgi:hypothetical protein
MPDLSRVSRSIQNLTLSPRPEGAISQVRRPESRYLDLREGELPQGVLHNPKKTSQLGVERGQMLRHSGAAGCP